jgi:Tfp pilus assembly protein PilX
MTGQDRKIQDKGLFKGFKNQKGVILIMSFVIMAALMVIVIAYITLTSSEMRTIGGQLSNTESFYAAESGIQYAVYRLKTNINWNENGTVVHNIGRGSFVVSVRNLSGATPPAVYKRITSTGTVERLSRVVKLDLTITP